MRSAVLLVLAAALVAPLPASAGKEKGEKRLSAPPGFYAAVRRETGSAGNCEALPEPYTAPLSFPSKYEGSDAARDDLNPKALATYKQRTAPISTLEKEFAALVGDYMRGGDPKLLRCGIEALGRWAEAGALEGAAQDHTGKAVRKWALSSLASAYLRLKLSPSEPLRAFAKEATLVEAWFDRLAQKVVQDWDDQPLRKVNNHEYWAAWAVMATAVILNRREFYDWALDQYRIAAQQVDENGYLPNELRRETRALAYHNYALTPLAMIAAFAKANGQDLAREGDRALERLARRVLLGIDNPGIFEARTGAKQELEDLDSKSKFAWLEPYCWTVSCEGRLLERISSMRPLKTYRLGGNVTEVFAPQPRRAAPPPPWSPGTAVGQALSDPDPTRSRAQEGHPTWMPPAST